MTVSTLGVYIYFLLPLGQRTAPNQRYWSHDIIIHLLVPSQHQNRTPKDVSICTSPQHWRRSPSSRPRRSPTRGARTGPSAASASPRSAGATTVPASSPRTCTRCTAILTTATSATPSSTTMRTTPSRGRGRCPTSRSPSAGTCPRPAACPTRLTTAPSRGRGVRPASCLCK